MTPARARLERRGGDLVVVGLLLAALLEIALAQGTPAAEQDTLADATPLVAVLFAVLWTLPLLARHVSGLAAGLGAMAALTVASLVSPAVTYSIVPFIAVIAVSAVIGFHEDRVRAALGGVALTLMLLVGLAAAGTEDVGAGDLFVILIFSFGPLVGGQVVRDLTRRNAELEARTEELHRIEKELAEAAVAEERARIANELHDVIAQGVSVMTMHAGGARLLIRQDRDRAREAILAVEEAGRQALAETRRLLGVLRSDGAERPLSPQPGMASLNGLVESLRQSDPGKPITVSVEGDQRSLPPGLELAAYRLVADTLNEGRRREARSARVQLRWSPTCLELEVAGDIAATPPNAETWLAAMRERLGLYGATIDYEILADGFHAVRARIPLEVTS